MEVIVNWMHEIRQSFLVQAAHLPGTITGIRF